MKLTEQNIIDSASALNVEPAVIKAVLDVESGGSGFLASGKPIILFEGHIFHKYTGGKYTKANPTISYPKWTKQFYLGGEKEWSRFNQAFKLDKEAAMLSTSYGLFQVMGFNFKPSGFNTVDSFVDAMKESEFAQLISFTKFIISLGLDDELRNKQWAAFAVRYNGSGYRANKYDEKLDKAYKKHSKTK